MVSEDKKARRPAYGSMLSILRSCCVMASSGLVTVVFGRCKIWIDGAGGGGGDGFSVTTGCGDRNGGIGSVFGSGDD